MKTRWMISLLLIFLLVSCAPEPTEQDTDIVVAVEPNTEVLEAIASACESGDMGPIHHSVLTPIDASSPVNLTLTWDMECVPNEYEIKITHYGNEASSVWESLFNPAPPTLEEWTKLITLEPATAYQWKLHAFDANGNTLPDRDYGGYFRTGPICGVGDLVAPTLVSPADGTVDTGKGEYSTEVYAEIKYPVGECAPDRFEIEYSTNMDFIETKNLNPSGPTLGKKEGAWWIYGDDFSGTQDCNLYYWRARAVSDLSPGPWSETFSFYLDIYGNCYKFPEFKALQTTNCRRDPWIGENTNHVSAMYTGDTAELLGLNEDATWGMFKLKNELECWVNMSVLEPVPQDMVFFPGLYPVLETGDPPDVVVPVEEPESEGEPEPQQGCMVPNDRTGALVCKIPCPDPKYAARVCSE